MEGFLIRGWKIILLGFGEAAVLARGATLAARWVHEPQPISNHPVGLGFSHPAGRCRPGGSASSAPCWWSCKDMEGLLIRGWEIILPGCGGTSALARGATLAARSLHEPQPISNHPGSWVFHILRGRNDPGDLGFGPQVVGVVIIWKDF